MASQIKNTLLFFLIFIAGIATGRILPQAAQEQQLQSQEQQHPSHEQQRPKLEWKREGEAIRLTARSSDRQYLVVRWGVSEPPQKSGEKILGSGSFSADARHPLIIFEPVLWCGRACEPCKNRIAACIEPPVPPPTRLKTWILAPRQTSLSENSQNE